MIIAALFGAFFAKIKLRLFYTIACGYVCAPRKFVMPTILICLILVYAGLGIFTFGSTTRPEIIKDYPLKAELAVLGAAFKPMHRCRIAHTRHSRQSIDYGLRLFRQFDCMVNAAGVFRW